MSYAIISLGGKQYRVREGERLLVDRLPDEEGATVTPRVLLVGGDGAPDLAPGDGVVTARVVGHVLGDKLRIGKYKPKTGYRRHAGFRARLSELEIETIGDPERTGRPKRAQKPKADDEAGAETRRPRKSKAAAAGDAESGTQAKDAPKRRRTKKEEG